MDGEARVWNTKITREGPVFCAYQRSFLDSRISNGLDVVAFSRDPRRLLTLARGKVARVWDTGSGRELARLGTVAATDAWGFSTTETPVTCCAAFSGDASFVATGHEDGSAAVWNAESGKKLRSIKGNGAAINHIQFDSAGRHVITAGEDGTVRFWHARTGRCALTLGPVGSAAVSVLLNRDESLLAVSHKDKSVTLWQMGSCRLIARLGDADEPALDPIFDEAEPALRTAGANDGSIRVWDLNSGALERRESFQVARSSVYSGWTLQASFFIAADGEGEMRLWRRGGPEAPLVLRGHSKKILALALAPDGAVLLSGSEDESARLWDLSSGRQMAIFPAHGAAVAAVTFSPDGKLIATATREGSVHIWYARAADLKQEARSRLPLILRNGNSTEAALSSPAADPLPD
jgi:WD40 repeat protein